MYCFDLFRKVRVSSPLQSNYSQPKVRNKRAGTLYRQAKFSAIFFAFFWSTTFFQAQKAHADGLLSFERASLQVEAGTDVTLSPTLSHTPIIGVYVWLKNGIAIGLNDSTLTPNSVQESDAGTYEVLYLNGIIEAGRASITLTVGETVSMSNLTVTEGQAISLASSLSVSALDPLYIWRKDGILLSAGIGATFTKASAELSDAGTYEVICFDGLQEIGRATATLTVNAEILLPQLIGGNIVAANATLTTQIDNGIDLLNGASFALDTDIAILSGALVSISATGAVTYKPNGQFDDLLIGESITDTFIVANAAGAVTITITINGTALPDAPLLTGLSTVNANATLTSQVTNGIDELNGASFALDTDITLPSGALISIDATGEFTYNPNGQFNALLIGESDTDSFALANAGGSTTITITINGTALPDAPLLTGLSTVNANATLTSQVTNGIDQLNGASFALDTDITLPSGALISIDATGEFTYNPNGQFNALLIGESDTDSFALANAGGSTTITLTINGTTPPDAPLLTGLSTVNANATLTSQVTNGIDQLNGASFALDTDITLPSGALISIDATGEFTYNPNGQFNALLIGESDTDSFALANAGGSTTITLTINGTTPPDAPFLTGLSTVNANATLTSQVTNGIDQLNGASFALDTDITLPSGALISIDATGEFTYNPNGQFNALLIGESDTDSFALANAGGSTTITITINGTTPPDAPLLTGLSTVNANATLTSQVTNGIDELNGASFALDTDITLPSGALISIDATGEFTYNPNGQFNALLIGESDTDSFALANAGGSTTITITINGTTPPDAPLLTGLSTVNANATLTSQVTNGIDELNGASFALDTDITLPSGALISIDATGEFTYNPNGQFNALLIGESDTDSFALANAGGSTTITITINGTGEEEPVGPPQLTGGDTVDADGTLTTQIDNGIDELNGASFTVDTEIAIASGATVSISATGAVTYNPNGQFDALLVGESDTDSFTVANSIGATTITLTINGTGVPDAPQLTGGSTVNADATLTTQIDNGITQLNGASFTVDTEIAIASGALVSISATGSVTYDPNGQFDFLNDGESTADSFIVANAGGPTTITITINGTGEEEPVGPPQLTGGDTVDADGTLTTQIDNGIDELNGASFTVDTEIAIASGATVSISATGAVTYNPNGQFDALLVGESDTDSFTVANSIGATTITLTINGTGEEEPVGPPQLTGGDTVDADGTLTTHISNGIDLLNGASFSFDTNIALPSGAIVSISASGSLTYDPNARFNHLNDGESATDSFTAANSKGSTTISLTINGTGGDDGSDEPVGPPQLTGGNSVTADGTLTTNISNGIDLLNGASFSFDTNIALPSGAIVSISASGSLTYDPNARFNHLNDGESATDSFTAANSKGSTTISLTINGTGGDEADAPPQWVGGNTVARDGTLTRQIGNGVDKINGASFTVNTTIPLPSGALVSIAATGMLSYNPNGRFNHLKTYQSATDRFTLGNSFGATNVTLTIAGTTVDDGEPVAALTAAKEVKADTTQRTISNNTTRRANHITSHNPELTIRLNPGLTLPSGNPAQFFASGTKKSYQMKFSTSLRQMIHASEFKKSQRRQALASTDLNPLTLADDISNTGFDIWVRGQWSDVSSGNSDSQLGLLQIGFDYRFDKNLVVGFLTQFDWTDEVNTSQNQDLNGTGWMAGPYIVTRLHKNLIFDASASWGQSDNDTRITGAAAGTYETDRWLLSARLTGDFHIDNFNIQPHVGLIYFREDIKGYTDSDDIFIRGQTVALGRLTFGPKLSMRFEHENGTIISPYIGARGIWDFEKAENIDVQTGLAVGTDDLRARIDAGMDIKLPGGITIHGEGFYDGIGTSDYEAIGGNLKLSIPLN